MMRAVRINVDLVDAWEVWDALIPDDIPDGEVDDWVKNNMSDVEIVDTHESGASHYVIESVTVFS